MDEKFEVLCGSPFGNFGLPYIFVTLCDVSEDQFCVERFVLLPASRANDSKILLKCQRTKARKKLGASISCLSADVIYEGEKRLSEEDIRSMLYELIGDKAFSYKANLFPVNVLSLSVASTSNPEFFKRLNEIQKSTNCSSLNRFVQDILNVKLQIIIEKPIG